MNPFFSVIIPTYNRLPFVRKAVESVLTQTWKDWELLVIDDGSTDGTPQWIRTLTDPRVVYRWQENQGVSMARNTGLRLAKGEWVAFLDSDDRFTPRKLERVRAAIETYPDIRVVHTEERWYRQGRLLNPKKKHQKPDGEVYHRAVQLCCISISTAVVHREVFDRVGVFDPALPACEDYDFWLRVTQRYPVKLIPEYLTIKDGGRPDQLSAQPCLDQYRIQALRRMLSSGSLTPRQREWTLAALQRKARIFVEGARKRGRMDIVAKYAQFVAS